ncbi:MAG TPA: glycosyltransferase family 2 protein, partial [Candidatus Paceibacterota bacterium]|nr:glycosyltransferase family 2 protein [Candidatus Paceibacterota bacterium]
MKNKKKLKDKMKLSILIPVYNEEKTVEKLIKKVKKVKLPIKKEIVVVDDKSTDKTLSILKKIKGIKLIEHKKNIGKGAAIKTAIKNSSGEIIIIQDADLEYNPEDYNALIEPIIEKKEKVVYGSRVLKKENRLYSSLEFYIGGNFLTLLTNILYPSAHITDEPTCYKVFRADVLKSIKLK